MIASRSSLGGGFPGLAVFSLLGLLLVLGAAALLILRPWEATTQDPHLSISPDTEVGLGDAVAVSPEQPARTGGLAVAVASPAAPAGGVASAPDRSSPRLAVAQLEPVAVGSPPPAPAPPQSGPQPTSPPETVEVPAASPPPTLVTEPERGAQQPKPPVNAGADPEACEGDEYEVRIALDPEAAVGSGAEVEIVIQRLGDEGEEVEAHLVGELGEVIALLETLVSEGDCAQVEVELGEEEPLSFEIPGEITALEEALEPFLV